MAPEIGTERSNNRKNKIPDIIWYFLFGIAFVTFGVGLYWAIDSGNTDQRKQSDIDIKNCIDLGGTVYLGSNNWFDKCIISP